MKFLLAIIFLLSIFDRMVLSKSFNLDSKIFLPNSDRLLLSVDSVRRDEAQKRCMYDGGRLATIQTEDDVTGLKSILDFEPNAYMFWIGGLYDKTENCRGLMFQDQCWYWDQAKGSNAYFNSTLIQFTQDSQAGYPPLSSGMLLLQGYELQLSYDIGSAIHPYICERILTPQTESTTNTTSTKTNCGC